MKTSTKNLVKFIASALIICSSFIAFAGEDPVLEEYRKDACLKITGKIDLIGDPQDGDEYRVELIYFNKVLKVLEIKEKNTFSFVIKRDSYYTIRITKNGYVSKLISINTNLDPSLTGVYCKFRFDTSLVPESDAVNMNPEVLDFPIALISFDEETGQFDNNTKYTNNIKKQLYSHNTVNR